VVGASELEDVEYQNLVKRVEAGDFTVDFRELRFACLKSSQCEPRATIAELRELNEAGDNFAKRAEIGERILQRGFANMEIHAELAAAYARIPDAAKSKFHLQVTAALMRSILNSGDGRTKERAFEVICDREDLAILASLHLPSSGQSVSASNIEDGGHRYVRTEIRRSETEDIVVFFNTDAFVPKSRLRDN
jgi:hypothetical protein